MLIFIFCIISWWQKYILSKELYINRGYLIIASEKLHEILKNDNKIYMIFFFHNRAIIINYYTAIYEKEREKYFFNTHSLFIEIHRKHSQSWSSNPRRLRRSWKPARIGIAILQKPDLRLKSARLVIPIKFSLYGTSVVRRRTLLESRVAEFFVARRMALPAIRTTWDANVWAEERDARPGATRCNSGL